MERQDGYSFDCKIPPFSLESKEETASTPSNFTWNDPAFILGQLEVVPEFCKILCYIKFVLHVSVVHVIVIRLDCFDRVAAGVVERGMNFAHASAGFFSLSVQWVTFLFYLLQMVV